MDGVKIKQQPAQFLWLMLIWSIWIPACQSPEPDAPVPPHLLAHRGLSRYAPENTLPALMAAIDLGLDIEMDVHQIHNSDQARIYTMWCLLTRETQMVLLLLFGVLSRQNFMCQVNF